MSSITLYELTRERAVLDQFLVETEGEETPTIAALFAELEGSVEQKAEKVALWLREKEAEAVALKAEEQRLCAKRKTRENAIASSKAYFAGLLEQLGRKEAGGPLAKLCIQANPPALDGELTQDQLAALEVEGDSRLRELVKLAPATRQLDRRAALEVLKGAMNDPSTIEGTALASLTIRRSVSLRIR